MKKMTMRRNIRDTVVNHRARARVSLFAGLDWTGAVYINITMRTQTHNYNTIA